MILDHSISNVNMILHHSISNVSMILDHSISNVSMILDHSISNVSMILDHSISNVSMILDHSISNVSSFKYLGIHISSDFTWTDHIEHLTGKVSQRLGLLKCIKHLLPFRARLLFYKSLVMPLFEYADLVWGDKHNITLISSLQVLQKKAAKVILNRPLYSSSTEALATLKWLPLEKRRFQRRCVHVYKCINGLINHDMDLIRQDVLHRHNTRNKGNFR